MRQPVHLINEMRILRQVPTEAERLLWSLLRRRQLDGHKFRRQALVAGHVLPFTCPRARLALSLHTGLATHDQAWAAELTSDVTSAGWRLLWIAEADVTGDTATVLQRIQRELAR